jgi:HlyD family secretion protein
VEEVLVHEGQTVDKGAVIARLSGGEKIAAEQAAAALDLLTAQQELQDLRDNAALSLAEAKLKLAEAEKELDKATRQRASREYRVGSDDQLDIAQADIVVARDTVRQAEDAYNSLAGLSDTDAMRAGALSALAATRQSLNRAEANYNYLLSMPNPLEVNLAQAKLELAQANVNTAKDLVAKLGAGADQSRVDQLEARIHSIEARLSAAKAEGAGLTLTAPISGVVVRLSFQAGELVSLGGPTVLLADLSRFEVELVNLTEIQVGRVQPGQAAVVRFDALPGLEMQGTVEQVDPQGENRQGDIVYRTIVALNEQNPELRWNMTVSAEIVP